MKLEFALDAFAIDPTGMAALDAGASTGGFTDVLLARGARVVYAVDVGTRSSTGVCARMSGCTSWSAPTPARRARDAPVGAGPRDLRPLIHLDRHGLGTGEALPGPGWRAMVMVKPQFEVGRERVGSGGVVRDPVARRTRSTAWSRSSRRRVAPCWARPTPACPARGQPRGLRPRGRRRGGVTSGAPLRSAEPIGIEEASPASAALLTHRDPAVTQSTLPAVLILGDAASRCWCPRARSSAPRPRLVRVDRQHALRAGGEDLILVLAATAASCGRWPARPGRAPP